MSDSRLHRIAAFTTTPDGGNPAGVWIGDALPDVAVMQRIASDVGYSETAFLAPSRGRHRVVRYYSAVAEVAFCGHATIAAGAQLGADEGPGTYTFDTAAGAVRVDVREAAPGVAAGPGVLGEAALTSVPPRHVPAPGELLRRALDALDWRADELDPGIPAALAFAGAWHLVIAAATAARLARLDYDFEAMRELMLGADLTTIQLIWRERIDLFHARDPFPVGGVVEDPATGAAAAALGGYLRDARMIDAPATIVVLQGEAMGRPSRLTVEIPETGGIVVRGHAVRLPEDPRRS